MATKKRQKYSNTLQLWQSATDTGKEKHFSQVGHSLLFSERFCELSVYAKLMYIYCLDRTSVANYFTMPQAIMLKAGFNKNTGSKALKELEQKAFIKKISSGKSTRTPNEYQFVYDWKGNDI